MSWLSPPPNTLPRPRALLVAALAVVLMAAGCSTKTDDTTQAAAGEPATGPGVTDQVIKLGVLTDRTGPFAAAGKSAEQGRQLFWDKKNAQGGVCNRKVEFVVKDHGYNAQNAVTAYAQIKDDVLALDELLGSPMIAGLLPDLETDQMLTMAASWSSNLLTNPYVVITGSTYDIEMINGIHWLIENKGLAKGDKIGHIFLEGDYGENAAAGSSAAAKEFGLQLIEQKIKPTDADLTGQVTALRGAGADFVLLTTTPAQTASAVGVAAASGYGATFLGSNPAFSPALLRSPAKSALEQRLLVTTSIAPFSSTAPGPSEVRNAFLAKYPDQLKTGFVMYGYAQGEIMANILAKACQNNALTRTGLLQAFQSLQDVQTNGLVPALDYSKPGQIPSRQVYLVRPDAKAAGGLTQVEAMFAAPFATTYQQSR
ncbi:ABC-type branched-subunit amino acid transport system substrate-binding protein [Kribbella steppae]|uniref:ABC-type branched-subunit amino acid transport system substrate-binding protein n=1 Tax=Kribbella steppae TaxID=2512223 RepID=A0A4V2RZR5_9ACTN|nr:ABC transporter substrate-binding protein [Kribbella steppae]TCO28070.1 ABC-type branched-subunit amino acid transport system substrate-binding protein [Kribbella steppae]